jgi:hypothetical protein
LSHDIKQHCQSSKLFEKREKRFGLLLRCEEALLRLAIVTRDKVPKKVARRVLQNSTVKANIVWFIQVLDCFANYFQTTTCGAADGYQEKKIKM